MKKKLSELPRREFIALSSLIALESELLANSTAQQDTSVPRVAAEPSPEEIRQIHDSRMAQDLVMFFGAGYSCAESGLAVCLRHLEKPEELVWFASGFGGGLGQGDLCGFLTSGIMAIGIYAGSLKVDRDEAKKTCGELVSRYWDWWTSGIPHRCQGIREGHEDERVCIRVGYLAMAKVEELIKEHSANV